MRKRIVFVVFSLRGGGAERVVCRLAEQLARQHQVVIVQLSDQKPFYTLPSRVRGVVYDGPDSGPMRFARLASYLFATLRAEQADVVVSIGETISPFVLAVGKLARQRVVVSNRASPATSIRGRRGRLNPLLFPLADAVWVQTRRAIEVLSPRYRGCRWMVLENPIDVPDAVPPDSERENLCVMVGYLGGKKNQAALIDAFARQAPGDWSLWIVGEGPDRQALEARAAAAGVSDRIRFPGAVHDVYEILQRAKVFAFTSRSEGFPNALAEAMACGCACIAFDCVAGPAELIEHEHSGLLVELDDQPGLEAGLSRLMSEPALRVALARGARGRAKRLRASEIADEFLRSISEVLERGREPDMAMEGREHVNA